MNEYLDIIQNIMDANTPFEILSNIDNLKWLFAKEKYNRTKIESINKRIGVNRYFKTYGFE